MATPTVGYLPPQTILANQIYVGNLLPHLQARTLYKVFAIFGVIRAVHKKENKTYAFIEFDNSESAKNAYVEMNGKFIEGKQIVVNKVRGCEENFEKISNAVKANIDESYFDASSSSLLIPCCKIIAEDSILRPYAEEIGRSLKSLRITNEISIMNCSSVSSQYDNFRKNGNFYAIIVTYQNWINKTFFLVFLNEKLTQNLNIPFHDGINLLNQDFSSHQSSLNFHPAHIIKFLKDLLLNIPLTATQYKVLIDYLSTKMEAQMKIELNGETLRMEENKNLQSKILQMLSEKKKFGVEIKKQDRKELMKNLKNNKDVKKALDVIKKTKL